MREFEKAEEYKIRKTKNYGMFKLLETNRDIDEKRIRKIKASFEKVGFIPNAVIVNERHEIIEGQGRYMAAKRMGIPVWYVVVPGIGKEECREMNINAEIWRLEDYIKSYAADGNINYMYLHQLIKRFKGTFTINTILSVAMGNISGNNGKVIREQRFECDEEMYNKTAEKLEYLKSFTGTIGKIRGHKDYYYHALTYCYEDPEIDNAKMVEKVTMLQANLIPVANVMQAMEKIEEIYNYRIRGGHVYIKNNYERCLENRYGWYSKKWGKESLKKTPNA